MDLLSKAPLLVDIAEQEVSVGALEQKLVRAYTCCGGASMEFEGQGGVSVEQC